LVVSCTLCPSGNIYLICPSQLLGFSEQTNATWVICHKPRHCGVLLRLPHILNAFVVHSIHGVATRFRSNLRSLMPHSCIPEIDEWRIMKGCTLSKGSDPGLYIRRVHPIAPSSCIIPTTHIPSGYPIQFATHKSLSINVAFLTSHAKLRKYSRDSSLSDPNL
jgi:hypothetical protein